MGAFHLVCYDGAMNTVMIAHRGAQLIAPENTLTAFKLAVRKGFRALECDVQLTKDGHLVVIHDETVDRTTDGVGWVSQLEQSKISKLSIGGIEHIPSLQAVFYEVVVKSKRKLIIELKADTHLHALKTATALASFLNKIPPRYRKLIEVHSFWYEALKMFTRDCPAVTTAAIINGGFTGEQIVNLAHDAEASGVSLGYEFISPKVVRQCHAAKLFVDTWAISDGTVMKRLRPFGINAVVENFTGTLIKLRPT